MYNVEVDVNILIVLLKRVLNVYEKLIDILFLIESVFVNN